MPKCDFNNVAKQSNFITVWVFSEHLFLRTPLCDCFCTEEAPLVYDSLQVQWFQVFYLEIGD